MTRDEYLKLAEENLNTGNFKKVLMMCDKLLDKNENDHAAYYLRGRVYNEIDDGVEDNISNAINNFNMSIEISPTYVPSILMRGYTYSYIFDYDNSLNDFNKVIELEPSMHNGYIGRASLYYMYGKYEDSIKDFLIAKSISPKNNNFDELIARSTNDIQIFIGLNIDKLNSDIDDIISLLFIIEKEIKKEPQEKSFFDDIVKEDIINFLLFLNYSTDGINDIVETNSFIYKSMNFITRQNTFKQCYFQIDNTDNFSYQFQYSFYLSVFNDIKSSNKYNPHLYERLYSIYERIGKSYLESLLSGLAFETLQKRL